MKKLSFGSILAVFLGLMVVRTGLAQTIPFPTYQECENQYGGELTFCHATSSQAHPYSKLTVACEALYGQLGSAGHVEENGTPAAGHEEDVMVDGTGLCPGESPSPSPSASASP